MRTTLVHLNYAYIISSQRRGMVGALFKEFYHVYTVQQIHMIVKWINYLFVFNC